MLICIFSRILRTPQIFFAGAETDCICTEGKTNSDLISAIWSKLLSKGNGNPHFGHTFTTGCAVDRSPSEGATTVAEDELGRWDRKPRTDNAC